MITMNQLIKTLLLNNKIIKMYKWALEVSVGNQLRKKKNNKENENLVLFGSILRNHQHNK